MKSRENSCDYAGGEVNAAYKIYEAISGKEFTGSNAEIITEMKESSYKKTMFCPVQRDIRKTISWYTVGSGDYGMNNHFRDEHRRISALTGKIEPFFMLGNTFNNCGPNTVNNSQMGSNHHYTTYDYFGKSLIMFIDGSSRFMSTGEGEAINSNVFQSNDFL